RIHEGAILQGAGERFAQLRDLLQEVGVGLREVAMNEALQAPGLAFQERQRIGSARSRSSAPATAPSAARGVAELDDAGDCGFGLMAHCAAWIRSINRPNFGSARIS